MGATHLPHLSIVEKASAATPLEEREIDRDLKRLDPDLFLDKEFDPRYGRVVYLVRLAQGEYPIVAFEWRDELGQPRPLNYALVAAMRQREGRGFTALQDARRANEERKQRLAASQEETYLTVTQEMVPHIKGQTKSILRKGRSLQMSRDRRRRAGVRGPNL